MFCKKGVIKKETPTQALSYQFCEIFCEHLFYWTPSVAASSKNKASGFTETVMQMNFWISHDLVHLIILSSSWRFRGFFLASTSFPLHLDSFFHIWYICFLTKDGNKLILALADFPLRKPLSELPQNNQHPAQFRRHRICGWENMTLLNCHVIT